MPGSLDQVMADEFRALLDLGEISEDVTYTSLATGQAKEIRAVVSHGKLLGNAPRGFDTGTLRGPGRYAVIAVHPGDVSAPADGDSIAVTMLNGSVSVFEVKEILPTGGIWKLWTVSDERGGW